MTRQLPGQITEMFRPRNFRFSDFPKLSVTALFWWGKGRRLLGPPKVWGFLLTASCGGRFVCSIRCHCCCSSMSMRRRDLLLEGILQPCVTYPLNGAAPQEEIRSCGFSSISRGGQCAIRQMCRPKPTRHTEKMAKGEESLASKWPFSLGGLGDIAYLQG